MFTTNRALHKKEDGGEKLLNRNFADSALQTPEPTAAGVVEKQGNRQSQKSGGKDALSDAMVVNKEQRKADWAIMKEMAKYLWPKVRSSC
jgi:ATP-binding cassette, subfamily B (MDR/TAP), member 7